VALTPLSLDSEERVTGLIRLLTMGLRGLTLREFGARHQLPDEGSKGQGERIKSPRRIGA
jgi:hypothetical protein